MQTLLQDLRYSVRMLLKNPGFALISVMTLALGIGANTAIFTVIDAMLSRGLPYEQPERLVHLWERTPRQSFPRREASYPDFEDWRRNNSFSGLTAYGGCALTLQGREAAEPIPCARVASDFFSVLGVKPILGRAFRLEEDRAGAPRVVMLSFSAWRRRFDGDPQIAGKTLNLNGELWTIIGVLPPSFHFAPRGAAEMWAPLIPAEAQRANRQQHWVNVIARLKPQTDYAQAEAEMRGIGRNIAAQHADSHGATEIQIVPLNEELIGGIKPMMFALLAAVGLVLLIACANVAGLMLVRAAGRRKEMAIRLALGAGRSRIVRQLLTESVLLAMIGGAAGLLLAQFGVEALIAAIPDVRLSAMPYLRELALDRRALAFNGGLALATGLVFGLAPALQASRQTLCETLKDGGRSSAGAGHQRLRQALVVGEIALALVLLISAGLMMKSFVNLLNVNPGFDAANLLTISLGVTGKKYEDRNARIALHQQLLARLETLPGVKGAAMIDRLPLIGGNTWVFTVSGRPALAAGEDLEANSRTISPNYFRVMGVPLISGRHFDERDRADAPGVIIINQELQRRVFPDENPIGRRIILPGIDGAFEIVGVAGDEKVNGLDAKTTPVMYGPFAQDSGSGMTLVMRTTDEPLKLAETVRREILTLEPGLIIYFTRSMESIAANMPGAFLRRFPALLIGLFALIALLLAAIGIYGVMANSVAQRTQEIGIRMALGAQAGDVLRLVIRQGMILLSIGVAIGLAASFAMTRLMKTLLFGVSATDPQTFILISALLALVAFLACLIPARRAAKVDPMTALRYE